ncbi:MAG: GTPase [Candidatus Bathyarchaeia archaeon]
MPTNLPAEAKNKWSEVVQARDPRVKLELLREFLSLVPKHKGTEKLYAKVRRQMALLRREIEEKKSRKGGSSQKFYVEKDGVAQVAIVGLTNTGRSSLLASVTNAKVEVSDLPFTTISPKPGILRYEDVNIQLVEIPPIFKGASKGKGLGSQTISLIRVADSLILMVDLSTEPIEQLETIVEELKEARIKVEKPRFRIRIERRRDSIGTRVNVKGCLVDCTVNDVIELLNQSNIHNAYLEIEGEVTLSDIKESLSTNFRYIPALIVANKYDLPQAQENYLRLKKYVEEKFGLNLLAVSCKTGYNLDKLGRELFNVFGVIRVYCKEPKEDPSPEPFILRTGATIYDLASQIHNDFIKRFSYARVWSNRLKFSPQRVGLNFKLEDGDIVEVRLKS